MRLTTFASTLAATLLILACGGGGSAIEDDPLIVISMVKLAPSSTHSRIIGGDGDLQTGAINGQPAIWRGTEESLVNLTPAGVFAGQVSAGDSSLQAGHIQVGTSDTIYASLWRGSAESYVDLNPVVPYTALTSSVTCSVAGRQGGYAGFSLGVVPFLGKTHPGVWNGTVQSWVSLLPNGCYYGVVNGISASAECGVVRFESEGFERAAYWSGTSASFKSLHPGNASASSALAMNDLYQVGQATVGGKPHAFAWKGTASSSIQLDRIAGSTSEARAVVDHFAAGCVDHIATIWNIKSRNFVKLDKLLPDGFNQSAISSAARTSDGYIFLGTISTFTGENQAAVWHVPTIRMPR